MIRSGSGPPGDLPAASGIDALNTPASNSLRHAMCRRTGCVDERSAYLPYKDAEGYRERSRYNRNHRCLLPPHRLGPGDRPLLRWAGHADAFAENVRLLVLDRVPNRHWRPLSRARIRCSAHFLDPRNQFQAWGTSVQGPQLPKSSGSIHNCRAVHTLRSPH